MAARLVLVLVDVGKSLEEPIHVIWELGNVEAAAKRRSPLVNTGRP
jgi:hypothetical protein